MSNEADGFKSEFGAHSVPHHSVDFHLTLLTLLYMSTNSQRGTRADTD